jgi:hypothetical protein
MPPSEPQVKAALGPLEARIWGCIDRAWKDFLGVPIRHKFRSARTRANIVFDLIAGEIVAEFDGEPNVRVLQKDETIKLLVGDCLLLRIKKANEDGLGSNIATQAVLDFVCQEPDIPGLLVDLQKVEVCYFEDATGAQIGAVYVTARDNDVKLWSYEIPRPAAFSAAIIPFPAPPSDHAPPEIEARKSEADNKSDDSEG